MEIRCTQHWYCCKWGWTLKLRLFASLYFCSGRRISIWLFVVNFNFIFSIGQRFRAGRYKISHLQQYLSVSGKLTVKYLVALDMKHANNNFSYIKRQVPIIYFFVLFLTSCNNKYDKQFYGWYENNDSSKNIFSSISFYENNTYSFYRSTCFHGMCDSGNFSLTNNTISFQSFNLPLCDTNVRTNKNLNKENFRYQSGKIFYIRHLSPPNKPSYYDTILIGQKKI